MAGSSGAPDTAITIIFLFSLFFVLLGYPIISESVWRGKTVGKVALGLRVVTIEGAPIRFRHALIRAAAEIIDVWGCGLLPGVVGAMAIVISKESQRFGDMAAGTVVIRERSGVRAPSAVAFHVPPGYEAYAATIDVSGLTQADYQTVRSYLVRAAALRPDARYRLAVQLATSLAARLRHNPPAGLAPDVFLAVVAARFQARGTQVWSTAEPSGTWGVEAPTPQEADAVTETGDTGFAVPR